MLYTLKEDKGVPKSYSLIRKESPQLEFELITKTGSEGPQEYVLADGIKSLTAEYTYFVPEKKEPKAKESAEAAKTTKPEAAKPSLRQEASAGSEAKKKEIKKIAEWIPQEKILRESLPTSQKASPDTQGERAKEEVNQLPLTPQLVELKLSLWDNQRKRSTLFTFKIHIQSDIPEQREPEDLTQKLLGTLREFFTQSFTPPAPTRRTQRNQFNMPRGPLRP